MKLLDILKSIFGADTLIKEGADVAKVGLRNKLVKHLVKHGIAYAVIAIFGLSMLISIVMGNDELTNKLFEFLSNIALNNI